MDSRSGFMPVERFEPSTLAGLVFETSAYTVPPHRPICICRIIIAHSALRSQYLNITFLGYLRVHLTLLDPPKFPYGTELLVALLKQIFNREAFKFFQMLEESLL